MGYRFRAPDSVILCKAGPPDDPTHLCLSRGGYIKKRKSSIVTSTFIGSCGSPGSAVLDTSGDCNGLRGSLSLVTNESNAWGSGLEGKARP